jgi:hypothetical protein
MMGDVVRQSKVLRSGFTLAGVAAIVVLLLLVGVGTTIQWGNPMMWVVVGPGILLFVAMLWGSAVWLGSDQLVERRWFYGRRRQVIAREAISAVQLGKCAWIVEQNQPCLQTRDGLVRLDSLRFAQRATAEKRAREIAAWAGVEFDSTAVAGVDPNKMW